MNCGTPGCIRGGPGKKAGGAKFEATDPLRGVRDVAIAGEDGATLGDGGVAKQIADAAVLA
jgi:hypothetical protein